MLSMARRFLFLSFFLPLFFICTTSHSDFFCHSEIFGDADIRKGSSNFWIFHQVERNNLARNLSIWNLPSLHSHPPVPLPSAAHTLVFLFPLLLYFLKKKLHISWLYFVPPCFFSPTLLTIFHLTHRFIWALFFCFLRVSSHIGAGV